MPKEVSERILYLDSIRGLAAVSVFLSHLIGAYPLAEFTHLNNSLLHIIWHGEGAVTLFFVLSGLVLSLHFFSNKASLNSFSFISYFTARLFRIMPLFWVVVVMSFACYAFLFIHYDTSLPASAWVKSLWNTEKTVKSTLQECLLILRIPPQSGDRLVPQDWTLTIEFVNSLALPFIVFLCLQKRKWMVLFIFLAIKLLGLSVFMFSFMLGIVISSDINLIRSKWQELHILVKYSVLALAILLYCSSFIFPMGFISIVNKFFIDITAIGSFLFLIVAIGSRTVQRILNWSILRLIGQLSYGIYLIHLMLIIVFTPYIFSLLNSFGIDNPYLVFSIGLLGTFGLTVAISLITYFTIEQPFIRLGKLLTRRFLYDTRYWTALLHKFLGTKHGIDAYTHTTQDVSSGIKSKAPYV